MATFTVFIKNIALNEVVELEGMNNREMTAREFIQCLVRFHCVPEYTVLLSPTRKQYRDLDKPFASNRALRNITSKKPLLYEGL